MQTSTSTAKYFFLELGIIAALYVSAVSFVTFSFDIINYLFPDRLAYSYDPYATGIRTAISVLIVVFPLFVALAHMMWKLLLVDTENRTLPVRRWLSYLTLFVAGGAVAGNLITLVNVFLSGEVTVRFIFKVLVVLVVALAVFFYTIKDLKGLFYEKPYLWKRVMVSTSVVVLVAIVGGFFIIGMPQSQRDLQDDQTRSNNLQSIQWEVVSHYQRTGKLPLSTNELIDPLYPNNADFLSDPVTNKPYEYRAIASTTPVFELCAEFTLASKVNEYEGRGGYPSGYSSKYAEVDFYPTYGDAFEHEAGRNCFTRIIDPVRYPVQKSVPVMVQ